VTTILSKWRSKIRKQLSGPKRQTLKRIERCRIFGWNEL